MSLSVLFAAATLRVRSSPSCPLFWLFAADFGADAEGTDVDMCGPRRYNDRLLLNTA